MRLFNLPPRLDPMGLTKSKPMKKITIPTISATSIKNWIQNIDRKVLVQNTIMTSAFFIFVLFFFLPVLHHNKRMTAEVKYLKEQVDSAKSKIIKIPEMRRQKELFGTRIKKIREQFFEAEEGDQLLEIVSSLASEAGVRISASRPIEDASEPPAPFNDKYLALSYELVVEGMYHNLGEFVNGLERYTKNIAVLNFQISVALKNSTTHRATLVLSTYLKKGMG